MYFVRIRNSKVVNICFFLVSERTCQASLVRTILFIDETYIIAAERNEFLRNFMTCNQISILIYFVRELSFNKIMLFLFSDAMECPKGNESFTIYMANIGDTWLLLEFECWQDTMSFHLGPRSNTSLEAIFYQRINPIQKYPPNTCIFEVSIYLFKKVEPKMCVKTI